MTPRVVNVRRSTVGGSYVMVDRSTEWGNPYRCGPRDDASRRDAIAKFRRLLARRMSDPSYRARLRAELEGRDLGCHCKPLPCHGDVLLAAANCGELLD